MKDILPEYRILTKNETNDIWHSALFIFDTNILVTLSYECSKEVRNEYLDIFRSDQIFNRLWLPHHVVEEFCKLRYKKIVDNINNIQKLTENIDSKIKDLKEEIAKSNRNSFINTTSINNQIDELAESIRLELQTQIRNIDNHVDNYPFINSLDETSFEEICALFDKKCGSETAEKKLKEWKEDDKDIVKNLPGYRDNTKNNNSDGDYIAFLIWTRYNSNSG